MKKIDEKKVEIAIQDLLEALGQDPMSDGLVGTPGRVARAYSEMLAGYQLNPAELLKTAFDGGDYDQMVALKQIPFYSLCEHHLLPFIGEASVVYIPNGKVVGLSKLARLVECFGRRLQIQERMTNQIGKALQEYLSPVGYGVTVKARHLCMCARGVQKEGALMITHCVGGLIKEDEKARAEFLQLCGS